MVSEAHGAARSRGVKYNLEVIILITVVFVLMGTYAMLRVADTFHEKYPSQRERFAWMCAGVLATFIVAGLTWHITDRILDIRDYGENGTGTHFCDPAVEKCVSPGGYGAVPIQKSK